MKSKTAYLVINPKAGDNLAKLPDLLAVFAAAGWKTDTAVKEYGSHAAKLAQDGADAKYDLVIAYGGDGTLNQVVNGVMRAKRRNSAVGLIPGGTANVWATEIGIPADPVKAALSLVNSEARKVDVGHVAVESLTFLEPSTGKRQPGLTSEAADEKTRVKREKTMKVKPRRRARHHFLLMAGLGIDAAIMRRVSKSLKDKIGTAAVALAAAEEMPSHKAFPIEISASRRGGEPKVLWKGEALQVVIGNTRRYGNIAELTPKAKIDDGVLDVCVITAGSPLNTMQQILSVLLQRKADNASAEYFHGADFTISVPASIQMQVDGSAVKLKDHLRKSDWTAFSQAAKTSDVTVHYRFDAMPGALLVAVPSTCNDALFEHGVDSAKTQPVEAPEAVIQEIQQQADAIASGDASKSKPSLTEEQIAALLGDGQKVTVTGTSANPEKAGTYIVAGSASNGHRGDSKPVAVRLDDKTKLLNRAGQNLPLAFATQLREGGEIVVEGKPNKRGVIRARRIVVV